MNFLNFGASRVIKLTDDVFDLMIPAGVKGFLIGLAAGLILIFIASKLKLLKRGLKISKVMVAGYYFYIPVVLGISLGLFGAFEKAEQFTIGEVYNTISPIIKISFPTYQLHLYNEWGRIEAEKLSFDNTIDEFNSTLDFPPKSGSFLDDQKSRASNFMVPNIIKWGIEAVVETKREVSISASREDPLITARDFKLSDLSHEGWLMMEDRIREKIKVFFDGMRRMVIKYSILLLLFPVVETILYKLMYRGDIQ